MGKSITKKNSADYPVFPQWYVLYVKSRAEKKVRDRLEKNEIEVFLPLMKVVRQWSDRKKQVQVPLFNGYLFLYIDPEQFSFIKMIEGVVGFVKQESKNATISEGEISTIRKFLETGVHIEAENDVFQPGEKVKINFGPLKGFTGELIEIKNEKQFIVRLSVINQVLKISVPVHYLQKV